MKKATVLKDISPEVKKGDTLVLNEDVNQYVKEGSEMEIVEHKVRYGLLNLRTRTVLSPNHYPKDQVESMDSWFAVEDDQKPKQLVVNLVCTIGTSTLTNGRNYLGNMLRMNPNTGRYDLVDTFEEAEMFEVARNNQGKTKRYGIRRFREPGLYDNGQPHGGVLKSYVV